MSQAVLRVSCMALKTVDSLRNSVMRTFNVCDPREDNVHLSTRQESETQSARKVLFDMAKWILKNRIIVL